MSHRVVRVLAPQTSRLAWVDYARGIGIFLVVVGHTLRGLLNSGLMEPSAVAQFVDDWIYSFHMPLFFFVSGLFAERSAAKGPTQFVSDKLRTIAYPYVVWAVLQTSIQAALSGHTNNPTRWQDVAVIWYVPPMQFWFLYALFVCFLLFLALRQLGVGSWGLVAASAALAVIQAQVGLGPWGVLYQVGSFLPYFALGAASHVAVGNVLAQSGSGAKAFAAAGGYALLVLAVLSDHTHYLHHMPVALLSIAATLAFADLLSRRRIFGWVGGWGRASLPIFLAHTLSSAGFRIALQRLAHVNDPAVHFVGGVAAGVYGPVLLGEAAYSIGLRYLFSWPSKMVPTNAAPEQLAEPSQTVTELAPVATARPTTE